MLFLLPQHGHQVKYYNGQATSLPIWQSWPLMVTTLSTCAPLSSKPAVNSQETWAIYDANYRQKAEATRNRDWSAIDTTCFSQCFTGKARKVEGCTNCGSLKHETTECPRKKENDQRAKLHPLSSKSRNQMCTLIGIISVHATCPYKHECIKCSPEDHQFLHCPKRLKKGGSRNNSSTHSRTHSFLC